MIQEKGCALRVSSTITFSEQGADADDEFDIIHTRLLQSFPDLVVELGGDPKSLLHQAGIGAETSPAAVSAATYRQAVRLMESAAVALECSDFGMRLAHMQGGVGIFGPLGLAMQNSRTFGDALAYVQKHIYAHSLATRLWLERLPCEHEIFAGFGILVDRIPHPAQTMEQLLLAGHLAAQELTGGRARARRVHFRHQPLSGPKTYRRYFGCDVLFGQEEDGLLYLEQDLACPVHDANAEAFAEIAGFIDREFTRHRPPFHAETRGIIMRLLATGASSNGRVARELNVHVRTLHRRLREEGTSFQQIKDEVRRDVMLYYLQRTDLEFSQISEKLGFAEQSLLTRSCRRWFSMSPTQMRAAARSAT